MTTARKTTPILFSEVRKLDAENKLDIEATLGEIVKLKYNRSEWRETNHAPEFTGTFNVKLSVTAMAFFIESDNDTEQLQFLQPWIGTVKFTMPGVMTTCIYSSSAIKEFVNCMRDNDIWMTDEVFEFFKTDRIAASDQQLIHDCYQPHARELLKIFLSFLTADPSGVVLRFLVGDALAVKVLSAPQRFFHPKTEMHSESGQDPRNTLNLKH